MRKLLKVGKLVYFFGCWWVLLGIDAQAYIDPSAVTYVIQAVAAVFIALGAMVTVFRHKIFAFLKKKSKKTTKREIHLTDESEENSSDDLTNK